LTLSTYAPSLADGRRQDAGSSVRHRSTPQSRGSRFKKRFGDDVASVETQGYDIVANFGDQYSDLNGGFADRTYKIPNPMYYLP
jgi:hypothetical protein